MAVVITCKECAAQRIWRHPGSVATTFLMAAWTAPRLSPIMPTTLPPAASRSVLHCIPVVQPKPKQPATCQCLTEFLCHYAGLCKTASKMPDHCTTQQHWWFCRDEQWKNKQFTSSLFPKCLSTHQMQCRCCNHVCVPEFLHVLYSQHWSSVLIIAHAQTFNTEIKKWFKNTTPTGELRCKFQPKQWFINSFICKTIDSKHHS
jgi:hypothetical protein